MQRPKSGSGAQIADKRAISDRFRDAPATSRIAWLHLTSSAILYDQFLKLKFDPKRHPEPCCLAPLPSSAQTHAVQHARRAADPPRRPRLQQAGGAHVAPRQPARGRRGGRLRRPQRLLDALARRAARRDVGRRRGRRARAELQLGARPEGRRAPAAARRHPRPVALGGAGVGRRLGGRARGRPRALAVLLPPPARAAPNVRRAARRRRRHAAAARPPRVLRRPRLRRAADAAVPLAHPRLVGLHAAAGGVARLRRVAEGARGRRPDQGAARRLPAERVVPRRRGGGARRLDVDDLAHCVHRGQGQATLVPAPFSAPLVYPHGTQASEHAHARGRPASAAAAARLALLAVPAPAEPPPAKPAPSTGCSRGARRSRRPPRCRPRPAPTASTGWRCARGPRASRCGSSSKYRIVSPLYA